MIDIAIVRTLLRINGLTTDSPRAQIEAALRGARYSESDINDVFDLLGPGEATAVATEASAVQTVPTTQPAPTTFPPVTLGKVEDVKQRAPLWEVILGWAIVALYVLLTALYVLRIVPNLKMIWMGYEGNTQILDQFLLFYFLPAIGVSVVIMIVAFFLARLTNPARTLGGWIAVFFSWYAAIWFLALFGLLQGLAWYAKNGLEDWMSFAFSLLASFGLAFAQAAFVLMGGVTILLGALSYLKRPKVHTSLVARILCGVVLVGTLASLTYYSGAMKYPARALKLGFLCYAIAGSTERQGCLNASVYIPTGESTLDRVKTPYVHYGYKSTPVFLNGQFIFVGNDISAPDKGPFLVRDGVAEELPDGIFPQQLYAAGDTLAYIGFDRSGDRYAGLLYINGVRDTSYVDAESLAVIHGKLAIFARKGEENYITWDGRTFTLPPGKEVGEGVVHMTEVGMDAIAYAYRDAGGRWHVAVNGTEIVEPFTGSITDFTNINGQVAYVYSVTDSSRKTIAAGVQVGANQYPFEGTKGYTVPLKDGIAVLTRPIGTFVPIREPENSIGGLIAGAYVPDAKPGLAIHYNGSVYTGYDRLSIPQSMNGALAFAAQQGEEIIVYVDGKEHARIPAEGALQYFEVSPGGRWVVVLVGEGTSHYVYVDGRRLEGTFAQAALYGEHLVTSRVSDTKVEVYVDEVLFDVGIGISRPTLFDGKMLTFATDLSSRRAYIVADPGLLSEEVQKNLSDGT